MFKAGWMRLWLVVSVVVLSAASIWSAYFVWGADACRKLLTVSIAETAATDRRSLAQSIESKVTSQPHCGRNVNSDFLTLDSLAKQGTVTQIAVEWLEPGGWTADTRGTIDILNGREISAEELIARSTKYVREARLKYVGPLLAAVAALCVGALLIGLGIAWARAGFRNAV